MTLQSKWRTFRQSSLTPVTGLSIGGDNTATVIVTDNDGRFMTNNNYDLSDL